MREESRRRSVREQPTFFDFGTQGFQESTKGIFSSLKQKGFQVRPNFIIDFFGGNPLKAPELLFLGNPFRRPKKPQNFIWGGQQFQCRPPFFFSKKILPRRIEGTARARILQTRIFFGEPTKTFREKTFSVVRPQGPHF